MAEKDLAKEIETLRADLAKLRDDIGGLADAVQQTVKNETKEYSDRAKRLGESARSGAGRVAAGAADRGRQSISAVEAHIEERPLMSVLMALGIGLLIGKLLDR